MPDGIRDTKLEQRFNRTQRAYFNQAGFESFGRPGQMAQETFNEGFRVGRVERVTYLVNGVIEAYVRNTNTVGEYSLTQVGEYTVEGPCYSTVPVAPGDLVYFGNPTGHPSGPYVIWSRTTPHRNQHFSAAQIGSAQTWSGTNPSEHIIAERNVSVTTPIVSYTYTGRLLLSVAGNPGESGEVFIKALVFMKMYDGNDDQVPQLGLGGDTSILTAVGVASVNQTVRFDGTAAFQIGRLRYPNTYTLEGLDDGDYNRKLQLILRLSIFPTGTFTNASGSATASVVSITETDHNLLPQTLTLN